MSEYYVDLTKKISKDTLAAINSIDSVENKLDTKIDTVKSKVEATERELDIKITKTDLKYENKVKQLEDKYRFLDKAIEADFCINKIDLNKAQRSNEYTNFYTYLTLLVSALMFLTVFSIRNYNNGDYHSAVIYVAIGLILLIVGIKTYLSFKKRSKHYSEEIDKYNKRLKKV